MLQQILLNKRDGISAVRPKARWEFVIKVVSRMGMPFFFFVSVFTQSFNLVQ